MGRMLKSWLSATVSRWVIGEAETRAMVLAATAKVVDFILMIDEVVVFCWWLLMVSE